ncbi:hypothetical protein FKW77_004733 [Venturia effusa]|uniref:Uncharacterized protein n=1 Tax=Venturia effusa TaxID=50376 RepID=A0A517LC96_9PEZI|nr:hypothetical protein FKW77_004733 [Venturia effusa]
MDDLQTVVSREMRVRNMKKRKLPKENDLVLLPYLGARQSPEIILQVESDPIEEAQPSAPTNSKRAVQTPSRSRRRPLQSRQRNVRTPSGKPSPVSDTFNFRALKRALPVAKSSMKNLARDGFDDHELVLPPAIKRKKTTIGRAHLTIPTLDLTNVRDEKELPMACNRPLLRQAKDMNSESDNTQLPEQFEYPSFNDTELMAQSTEALDDVVMTSPKKVADAHAVLHTRPAKRVRRVSFSDDVQRQLLSITAPIREPSDSEDDSETSDYQTDSASEADDSAVAEFEEIKFDAAREIGYRNAELDDIEDEGLLLETCNAESDINDKHETYITPRLLGRLPLVTRYIWNGFSRTWHNHEYARHRFGLRYLSKPWLLFDVEELEIVEELINRADDKKVMMFRRHQLDAFQMVAIVGALVAGAAITMMQLPGMEEVTYVARAFFIIALVMALLAAFFTCIQQRTYGFIEEPAAIRAWLTNGIRYVNCEGREVYQSSTNSHQLLQAPFELLCISFSTFIAGIGVYLGSAMTQHINLY